MLLRAIATKNRTPKVQRASTLIGVEQEFDLLHGERTLDFRRYFPHVVAQIRSVPFRNCDSAVILDAGYMLACDGQEAELATAPIHAGGDGCLTLAHEVSRCRTHLVKLLAKNGIRQVRGYSTHLNISVPIGREWEIATAFAATVAPALTLLMEAKASPGLLIRPRRGRLEIGSEYIDDERQLAAAILLLTGAVHAYFHDPALWKEFPRLRLRKWEYANIRPGIYLPHDAYGESMHEQGRRARLQLANGERMTARKILESCAALALRALTGQISPSTARSLQHIVRREGFLQIEQTGNPGLIRNHSRYASAREAKILTLLASPQNDITPVFVDWEGVAFSWKGKPSPLVLGIPWNDLSQFFAVARHKEIPQFVESLGPVVGELNSLHQMRSPRAYVSLDPVALGTQALTDKGMHATTKGGGTHKRPKRIEHVDFPEAEKLPVPAERETRPLADLAQTMITPRPMTDFAPTMIMRRPVLYTPVSRSSASVAQPKATRRSSRNNLLWLIALVLGMVAVAVLVTSVGIVVLSQAFPAKTPTSASAGVVVLPQANFTPTLEWTATIPSAATASASATPSASFTPSPSATPAIPLFTLHENAFCRKGPGTSYADVTAIPNGDTVEIKGVSQDGFWYFVLWRKFNVECWVSASSGQASGNSQGVPVLAAPSASTPRPTAAATRTKPAPTPTHYMTPTLLP